MFWHTWPSTPEWAKSLISRVSSTLEGMRWEDLAKCPSCEGRVREALEAIARVGDAAHEEATTYYGKAVVQCLYGQEDCSGYARTK